jgi:hypothetical protein
MSRPYKIVNNTSKWATEVLTPLFDLAWDVAWKEKDPIMEHPLWEGQGRPADIKKKCVYTITVTHNSRTARGRAWTTRCLLRLGTGERKWPMRLCYSKWKDMPEYEARNWHEMIIRIAAHEFSHLTGYCGGKKGEEMCEMTAWDAIDAYRKRQAEIDGTIDSALKGVQERTVLALQRAEVKKVLAVQRAYERNSPKYKLARLAAKEKVWLRKLRLALSKMKGIKCSRAAIVRWQNHKVDALVPMEMAATQEPPCNSDTTSTGN